MTIAAAPAKVLWILNRSPEMDGATFESLAATACRLGFDSPPRPQAPYRARDSGT